jgi:diaminopimelate epimerase
MDLPFVKMEGAGNDYVHVDAIRSAFPFERGSELAQRWSDRHRGIGGDGLILMLPSRTADVRMVMWNSDGSRGALCGNGLRCVAKLAFDHGHATGDGVRVETDVGVRAVELWFERGAVVGASAELGAVCTSRQGVIVEAAGRRLEYHAADAGNPHAVVFLADDPDAFPVVECGRALQSLAAFPGGVNVEFVQLQADGSLRQRTFERGTGETLACGTGAAAAAATAMDLGLLPGPEVVVRLRGGALSVRRSGSGLVIGGPARTVYRGVIELPSQP